MVRFRHIRADKKLHHYFPYYTEKWFHYTEGFCNNMTDEQGWKDIWQKDKDRDMLHRKNSYYYSREAEFIPDSFQQSPTFAIVLFGSILFVVFVPQIIDLFITVFCPAPMPPPNPPTPPPGPKSHKRLRLYHYAFENTDPMLPSLRGTFSYDPEDILNYVSATQIKTIEDYNKQKEKAALSAAANAV